MMPACREIPNWAAILTATILPLLAAAQGQRPPWESGASPPDVFHVYAELSGRTVLRPSVLPKIVVTNLPPDTNAALAALEAAFATARIETVRDGEKFVRLQPSSMHSNFEKALSEIKPPTNRGPVTLRTHEINISSATLDMVIAVLCEFRQRTPLRSVYIPAASIVFQNQTDLSLDEVRYGFEVVLAMNGIAVVDDGEKFIQIVPLTEKSRVETNAPQPHANEKIIAKDRIPIFDQIPLSLRAVQPPPPPPPPLNQQLAKVVVDFYKELTSPRKPPQFPATVDAMFEFYGRVVDKKTVMATQTNQTAYFKAVTPLTKPELAYAIETTLRLNQVAIVPVDEDTVRTMRLHEARALQKNKAAEQPPPTEKNKSQ